MAAGAALTAFVLSAARGYRSRRLPDSQRRSAPAAPDRLGPLRCARRPEERQRPLPDAEMIYGEVSSQSLVWADRLLIGLSSGSNRKRPPDEAASEVAGLDLTSAMLRPERAPN